MTEHRPPYQTKLPLDREADPGGPAPDETAARRQARNAQIRRALASGDTAGAALLVQLATLQALERIEARLAEIEAKLDGGRSSSPQRGELEGGDDAKGDSA